MSNKPIDIPNNCYECESAQSCKVLPRWGEKETLDKYRNRRHKGCPYSWFVELAHELYGEGADDENMDVL